MKYESILFISVFQVTDTKLRLIPHKSHNAGQYYIYNKCKHFIGH